MRTVLVLMLLCGGCYRSGAHPVVAPDGRQAYSITCDREVDCQQIAGEKCPSGYDVLKADKHVDIYMSWSTYEHTMLITCTTRAPRT